jgi:hypothetical protein
LRLAFISGANELLDIAVGNTTLKVLPHALDTKHMSALVELDAILARLVREADLAEEERGEKLGFELILVVHLNEIECAGLLDGTRALSHSTLLPADYQISRV